MLGRLPRRCIEFRRAPETPLRLPRGSRHDAVADLMTVEKLGNRLQVRSAVMRVQRLGHASIRMTADVYGHLFPRGDDGAELAAAEQALLA
jgi:integrase